MAPVLKPQQQPHMAQVRALGPHVVRVRAPGLRVLQNCVSRYKVQAAEEIVLNGKANLMSDEVNGE
jgi:hypothetical protein